MHIKKYSFILLLSLQLCPISLASQKSGHPKPRLEESAAKKQKTTGTQPLTPLPEQSSAMSALVSVAATAAAQLSVASNPTAAIDPKFGDPAMPQNALLYAIEARDIAKIQALLMQPGLVDINGFPKLLPLPGSEYTEGTMTPLMLAASTGDVQIVRMLINAGADSNKQKHGFTAIMYASVHGHVHMVTELITSRVDLNKKTERGNTALQCALHNGQLASAQLLIQTGVAINNCNNNGSTALIFAAEKGYTAIVESLLKHGANPNIQHKKSGTTALMYAARDGQNKIIDVLSNSKADPNIQKCDGATALMIAVHGNTIKAVKALLLAHRNRRFNIDFLKKMSGGCTALDLAITKYRTVPLKFLLAEPDVVRFQLLNLVEFGRRLRALSNMPQNLARQAAMQAQAARLDAKLKRVDDLFYYLIERSNVNAVKEYLRNCKDVRIYDIGWRNPLHRALLTRIVLLTKKNSNKELLHKNLEIIGLLLAYNPHLLWEEDRDGIRPIELAVHDPAVLRLLIKLAYTKDQPQLSVNSSFRASQSFAKQAPWQASSAAQGINSTQSAASSSSTIVPSNSITAANNSNNLLLSANGRYAAAVSDEPLLSANGRYGAAASDEATVTGLLQNSALADITARAAVIAQLAASESSNASSSSEPTNTSEAALDASVFIVEEDSNSVSTHK